MLTIVFLFVCYVSVFIITVLLLFLICMVLNICNFIQRTEQVPIELDISAIEDYILLLYKGTNTRKKPNINMLSDNL